MFDMRSSYCENFIYISLSIEMWHNIFENWRITKMRFFSAKGQFLKTLHKKQRRWIHHFLEKKAH